MNTDVSVFAQRVYEKLDGYYDEQRRYYNNQKANLKEYEKKIERIDNFYGKLLDGSGLEKKDLHGGKLITNYRSDVENTRKALDDFERGFKTGDSKEEKVYDCLLDDDMRKINDMAGDNPYAGFVKMLMHLQNLRGDITYSSEISELESYIKSVGKIPVLKGLDEQDACCMKDTLEAMKIVSELKSNNNRKAISVRANTYANNVTNDYVSDWFLSISHEIDRELLSAKAEKRSRREGRVYGSVKAVALCAILAFVGLGIGSIFPATEFMDGKVTDVEALVYRYTPVPITRTKSVGRVYLGGGELQYDGIKGGLPIFAPFAKSVNLDMYANILAAPLLSKQYENVDAITASYEFDNIHVDGFDNLKTINIEKNCKKSISISYCKKLEDINFDVAEFYGNDTAITIFRCDSLKNITVPDGVISVVITSCKSLEKISLPKTVEKVSIKGEMEKLESIEMYGNQNVDFVCDKEDVNIAYIEEN